MSEMYEDIINYENGESVEFWEAMHNLPMSKIAELHYRGEAVRAEIELAIEKLEEHAEWHRWKELNVELSDIQDQIGYSQDEYDRLMRHL